MKLAPSPRTLESSDSLPSTHFGIKSTGMAHILNILRNRLYSNKKVAIIREYCTNAFDAHVSVGKGKIPISVSLPTLLESVFSVRDFGPGLSEAEIREVFCFYGESTKRDSNKFVGQLGLGSKSAFAYTDQFTIISFLEGVKSTYSAFLDPSEIGMVAKLQEEPTDEPNGVLIQIAIAESDIEEFTASAYRTLRHFNPLPLINNTLEYPDDYKPATILHSGKNWRWTNLQEGPVAIMGGIAYPIRATDHQFSKLAFNALGLEIDFPIGGLVMQASREELDYNPNTIAAIDRKIDLILLEMELQVTQAVAQATSIYYATQTYNTLSRLVQLTKIKPTWKDQPISLNTVNLSSGSYVSCYKYRDDKLHRVEKLEDEIYPDAEKLILEENAKGIFRYKARLKKIFITQAPKSIQLVYFSPEKRDEDLKTLGFVPTSLESIEPLILPKRPKGTVIKKPTTFRAYRLSTYEFESETVDATNGSGYYYAYEGTITKQQSNAWRAMLNSIGVKREKVILLRPSQTKKLGPDWKPLLPEIEAYLHTQFVDESDWALFGILNSYESRCIKYFIEWARQQTLDIPKTSYFHEFIQKGLLLKNIQFDWPEAIKLHWTKNHGKDTTKAKNPYHNFIEKYPMLNWINTENSKSFKTALADYVNKQDTPA